MQIFNLFHRFVIYKIDLSHFLLYMIALFLLQIMFWRMIIFVPVTQNLALCLLALLFACWQQLFVDLKECVSSTWKKLTKKCVNEKFDTTVQHVLRSEAQKVYKEAWEVQKKIVFFLAEMGVSCFDWNNNNNI